MNRFIAWPLIPLVFLAATAETVAGQLSPNPRPTNDTIPFAPLARASYFWAAWPEGAMYEGDINIPVHLWSRTEALKDPLHERQNPSDCLPGPLASLADRFGLGAEDQRGSFKAPATGCTVTFIPHFVIRQLSGGSAPVRTPTFNPGFDFSWYRLSLGDTVTRPSLGGPVLRQNATLITNHLRLAHYSNGQAGCLYTNQQPGTCETIEGVPERLNQQDGSFSTHYVEGGVTASPVGFGPDGLERYLRSLSVSLRTHPQFLAPVGGMSDELARAYGRWSISGMYAMRWRDPASRYFRYRHTRAVSAEMECAPQRPDPYDPCRVAGGAFVAFPGLYGLGIAARYVWGWDYYNVGFQDRLRNHGSWFPVVGIMIDHSIPMRLR